MNKICVVGAGYVGLSLAVLLSKDNIVNLVEIDKRKLDLLKNKISPLKEDNLQKELSNRDKLYIFSDLNEAIKECEYAIIATPTNYDENTNKFDTSSIEGVLDTLVKQDIDIVIKSTIPVGYTVSMNKKYNTDRIIFSPEFLREGRALEDNLYPSRIIAGGREDICKRFSNILYNCSLNNPEIIIMGSTEAEAVKLFANTYLAMRVSFFNELDSYAISNKLDVKSLIKGVGLDPRIGTHYNNPSFGYGGYCLPKDTKQLKANFEGTPNNIITAIVDANNTRKDFLINDILKSNASNIGVYKLAMKKGSDNYRCSSIIDIINGLVKKGKNVFIYDKSINESSIFGCEVIKDLNEFKNKSDIIITNRFENELENVEGKVYTRDVFRCDE